MVINRFILYIGCVVSLLLYLFVGYGIERTETVSLLGSWFVLFAIYFYFISNRVDGNDLKILIATAIIFRLLFLFSTPALSDDYFRFIWDGEMLSQGVNPFLYTPTELLSTQGLVDITRFRNDLYSGLNSPDYYSVYPPVMQLVFWLSAKLSVSMLTAIVIMRIAIMLCEVGTVFILMKLLSIFNMDRSKVLVYALNPLVIIELTGNLHFEAIMIFFFVLSLYLLVSKKIVISAVAFALSVCTKMIPLILLPLLYWHLGFKKFLLYGSIVFASIMLFFIPFISNELITNISESIGLYFQTFEFNASIYYIIREIGYWIKGYNIIATAGKALPIIFLLFYAVFFFVKRSKDATDTFKNSIVILTVYYLLALIVHPWYVSLLIVLAVFADLKYPLVWSAMIGVTYITYITVPYSENLYAVTLEYIALLVAIIYDTRGVRTIRLT